MIVYNKLVRDLIPDIIQADGKTCEVRVPSPEDYADHLDIKLTEELKEYVEHRSVPELADIVEIIYAIVQNEGLTISEFEQMRVEKREERSGFGKKLLLVSVTE